MEKETLYGFVQKHLNEGTSLSDIQKLLETEHDHRMTYMDLRLISAELEVNWKKLDGTDVKDEADEADDAEGTVDTAADTVINADATLEGETVVNVSKLTRPGAMIHGDVTFKSGKTADWFVDSMGRLGLNPTGGSDDPGEEDVAEFQAKLQEAIQAGGMPGM